MSPRLSNQIPRDRVVSALALMIDTVDRAFPPARSTTYFSRKGGALNG